MKQIACLVALLFLTSALAQSLVCDTWGAPRKDFVDFEDPVIGFSKVGMYIPESGIAPDWYIVEGRIAPAMGFASHFALDANINTYVYVDRLEIGEHEAIPAEEWFSTPYIDSESLGHLFNRLAANAPTCTLTPTAAR